MSASNVNPSVAELTEMFGEKCAGCALAQIFKAKNGSGESPCGRAQQMMVAMANEEQPIQTPNDLSGGQS